MNYEGWMGDTPENDKRKARQSLENMTNRNEHVDDSISQDAMDTDMLRREKVIVEKYLQKLQVEKDTNGELITILTKITNLIKENLAINEEYYKKIRIQSEEVNPEDFPEEDFEKMSILSYLPKSEDDIERLQKITQKKDANNVELQKLSNEMWKKFPEDYEVILGLSRTTHNEKN